MSLQYKPSPLTKNSPEDTARWPDSVYCWSTISTNDAEKQEDNPCPVGSMCYSSFPSQRLCSRCSTFHPCCCFLSPAWASFHSLRLSEPRLSTLPSIPENRSAGSSSPPLAMRPN